MIRSYLDELTRRLRALMGDRLVAVWQVGSGALGDFDQLRSDIDVQALTAEPVGRGELETLAALLTEVPCPVRGLEFVLYAEPPRFALNLNTGPGMTHHEGYDPNAEERFWFVLDCAIARTNAVPLFGPHPREVLPEQPRGELLAAHRESLAWWREHDAAQAILAACRAWAWMSEGRFLSKGEAASWASTRLDDATPVAKALAHRVDAAAPDPTRDDVAAVVDHVLGVIPAP
ncbi:aminoglycoside adenylyltransferase domain-containing protein [Solirubrobacter soli]|uniref:aminoglycoside adenylyltransferase domain-containing protein n=1 Tax=Solirubrobacter soli TaxID=363832 RepID=UPI0004236424|nr:aminoglycoside adenylyltransferase domain-containing protein [Solirubrobacter soli]